MADYDNDKSDILITGTEEADSIKNTGNNVTIDADDGKDTIENSGASVTIDAGFGVDSINNSGEHVSISGGESGDYINNTGTNSTLNGDAGNDTVSNYAQYVTISGGKGNDNISNSSSFTSIDGGAGADVFYNSAANVVVIGGADNDTFTNRGSNVSIEGNAGNDSIRNEGSGSAVTIDGGDGDDTILSYGGGFASIKGGAGNDLIDNSGRDNTTIDAGEGNDTIKNSGEFFLGSGGDGNDYLENRGAQNVTITGGNGNDFIYNLVTGWGESSNHSLMMDGGEGSDTIHNEGNCVTINAGKGNDYIYNYYGDYTKVETKNVTISGGDGSDTITSTSKETSIDGGADDDTISSEGNDVTISGGAGNDSIKSTGDEILFKYAPGDGDDTITGFNESSRLRIGDGKTDTYATLKSGDDVIVYVGTGSILLVGAATLTELNIAGVENELPIWRLNGTTATYGTSTETLVTVSGVSSTDGLSIKSNVVTIAASSLGQSAVTISDGYTLAITDDVAAPTTTAAHWEYNNNVATYKNDYTSSGYQLVNNQIVYSAATGGETAVTVSGVKSKDGLSISGSTVTVEANSLNQANVSISNGYTLALSGVAAPNYTAAHWSGSTYKSASNTAGYSVVNNQIVYTAAQAETNLFTISGVKDTSDITINGSKITVPASALNQATVTISNGYTLAITDDVAAPQTTAAHWELNGSTATYKNDYTSAGYQLVNNQIVYSKASGGETAITVSGVKSHDGLSISGSTVTIPASALNQAAVTISNGYTLKLADDVTTPKTTAAHWEYNDSTATYKNSYTSAGYQLVNNQIVYSKASGGETAITVSGVKSHDGLSINGSTVTIPASALNQAAVTISNGYILKLADDVAAPKTTAAHWELNGSTATYKNSYTSAGYQLVNNQIVYSKASGGETAITVSGVKSKDGLSISGSTVTVPASALNQATVTISNGYTLKLADDVAAPKTTAAHWELNGSTATYKNSYTSAGYSISNNQITYSAATGGETAVTVSGVKSKDGLSINDSTITVGANALNQETVSVSSGYILALGNNVATPQTTAAHWEHSGSTATYKNDATSAGYKLLTNNQIVYSAANGGKTLITIKGVKALTGISKSGTTITLSTSSLNKKTVTISNGYTLALSGVSAPNYTAAHFVGTTYKSASNTAGYSVVNNQVMYTAEQAPIDLFKISGVKNTNGITVSGTVVTIPKAALSKATVLVSKGYTLEMANDVKVPQTTAAHWEFSGSTATYKNTATSAGYRLLANNQIAYSAANGGETLITVKGVKSSSGLTVNGKVVTVATSVLKNSNVTISGEGYTLKLADEVTNPVTTKAWTFNKKTKTSTYTQTTTAGYTLASNGKSITYSNKSTNNLIMVSGVKSASGFSIKKKVVTVAASALNKSTVTISDGYKLKLGFDVTKPTTKNAAWSLNGTTAIYKSSYKTAGYTLAKNSESISYTKATTASTLATINGVKSLDGISLNGKVVTVAASSLNNKSKVSITGDGYTLKLADDVTKLTTKKADFNFSGSTATYKSSYKTAGYTLAKNSKSISYIAATTAKTLATIKGAKSKSGLSISGKKITLKNSALNNKVTVSGGYEFNFAKNYNNATITGSAKADTITTNGKKLSISGGKGNDTIKIFGSGTTVKGGAGADVFICKSNNNVIADYNEEDFISIAGTAQATKSGSDVVFTVGSNKLTVTGGANKIISYVDSTGEHTYPKAGFVINGKTITLLEDYLKDSFNVADYDNDKNLQTIDASAVQFDMSIIGNKLRNSILGGDNNETLIGGKGNDTLTGGAGADVFVYASGDGNDLITDYAAEDKIKITSGKVSRAKKSGNNILLAVGNGTISVADAANKVVTYIDSAGEHTYPETVLFSSSDKAATILSSYTKDIFDINDHDDYKDMVKTIDTSLVTHDIEIIGNKLANSIKGGNNNETLTGGKSNDTLTGGEGADVFVYRSGDGNDFITDYTEEDIIQIAKGTAKVEKKNKDVIFTVGKGKITVKGAADKVVTYIDAKGKTNYYPAPTSDSIIINGTTVTVLEDYKSDTFDVAGKVKNGNKVKQIYASRVSHDLEIIGNAQANVILGGSGDDTIWGGKKDDTLQGDDGSDVFVYSSGDGKDIINDYKEEDKIKFMSGTPSVKTKGEDVIFSIGSGRITVTGAANKTVTYITNGKTKTYGAAALFVEDDNYEVTPNDLSSLVQSKSADYSLAEIPSTKNNLFPTLASSKK